MRLTADLSRPTRLPITPSAAGRGFPNVLPPVVSGRATRRLGPGGQSRVREFTRLAHRVAWRFARSQARDVPVDELIGESLLGLTYAAAMYDDGRDVPFPAYAGMVIRHRLVRWVRVWRRGRRLRLHRPLADDSGEAEVWDAEDRHPLWDPAAGATARELCERIRRLLPAHLWSILHAHYAEGHTLRSIGRRLGISRQRVRQLLDKAAHQVREQFPDSVDE
ncbi:MAG TPA: sigma-70 family RNA polymerase sigma factor [Gemmataceae bacterium]|nr:sigma-70 family RNA polymerase sigma factor [Gemmataceae bacterium]